MAEQLAGYLVAHSVELTVVGKVEKMVDLKENSKVEMTVALMVELKAVQRVEKMAELLVNLTAVSKVESWVLKKVVK